MASTGFFDRFGISGLGIPRFGSLSLSSLGDRVALRPPVSPHPLVGIGAVLLGAFIVTLGGRVTTFGLNDLRGAIHAGVDEGAGVDDSVGAADVAAGAEPAFAGVDSAPPPPHAKPNIPAAASAATMPHCVVFFMAELCTGLRRA